jgi:hypothetical protein
VLKKKKIPVRRQLSRRAVDVPQPVLDAERAYRLNRTMAKLQAYVQTVVWWYLKEDFEKKGRSANRVGFDEILCSVQAQTIIVWLTNKLAAPAKKTGKPPINRSPQSPFFGCPFTDLEGRWLVHQIDGRRSIGVLAACERLKAKVSDGRIKAPGNYVQRNEATTLQAHYTRAKSILQRHSA